MTWLWVVLGVMAGAGLVGAYFLWFLSRMFSRW